MLSWPLFKACEPHVILIGLSGLALLAVLMPTLWDRLWRSGVIAMAVIAPVLAVARTGRAIHRGAIEEEFGRWFRD